jgi:hypothetical protein
MPSFMIDRFGIAIVLLLCPVITAPIPDFVEFSSSHIVKKKVNRSQTINGALIEPGKSVSVSKRITDLADFIGFFINQVANSSSTAKDTYRPFNSTTLRETITDPNGRIISSNDTSPQTVNFSPNPGPKPHIPGKYTFTIKNIGSSPVNVKIEYGSILYRNPQTECLFLFPYNKNNSI